MKLKPAFVHLLPRRIVRFKSTNRAEALIPHQSWCQFDQVWRRSSHWGVLVRDSRGEYEVATIMVAIEPVGRVSRGPQYGSAWMPVKIDTSNRLLVGAVSRVSQSVVGWVHPLSLPIWVWRNQRNTWIRARLCLARGSLRPHWARGDQPVP